MLTGTFPKIRQISRRFSAFSPETIFEEDNIQNTVRKFAKLQAVKAQPALSAVRNAAVLIPLCVVDDQVSLLYTQRAANLKSHRGQISFPGGMEDSSDKTREDTALRETWEELGIERELVDVWGCGGVIVDMGLTAVSPVIGALHCDVPHDLKINREEVHEVFTVPLEVLCNPTAIKHTQFRTTQSLPVFFAGKRRIWGLTAIITHHFLRALLPKSVYGYNIKYIPPLKAAFPYRLL